MTSKIAAQVCANVVYKLVKDKNSNFKNLSIEGGKIKNLK